MTSLSNARRLLGLGPDADADAVHVARRRLAKQLHPDVKGGDVEAMQHLNDAADVVLRDLDGRLDAPGRAGSNHAAPAAAPAPTSSFPGLRVDHDVASFVIEALPVEAFEALLVVTSWIGEVLVDEPPHQLDVVLTEPLRCWCRLDLVPDAGASTVSVTIAALPDEPLPDIDAVRDLWVAMINDLGARDA